MGACLDDVFPLCHPTGGKNKQERRLVDFPQFTLKTKWEEFVMETQGIYPC